jgi:periplasmic protein TonB
MKSETIDPHTERFAVALFISTVLHLVIIYGMGFVMPKPGKPLNTTMEIILVQKSTEQIPEKADYLAQATHEGGGDGEPKNRPSTPTLAPFPEQTAELVFTPPPPQSAAELDESQTEILTTVKSTQHQIEAQTEIIPPDEPAEHGNALQNVIFDEYVSENTLFINTSAAKLASIQAELADSFNSYAKRLRHKYISASTKEFKYAHYMEAWRRKVEEIGNINYPNQARRRKLSGSLILDVALNPNGTIRQVEIKESSKHRILDEAALRIVRLAAPFAPFPENIRKNTDILHITRRWEFRYNSLTTRQ